MEGAGAGQGAGQGIHPNYASRDTRATPAFSLSLARSCTIRFVYYLYSFMRPFRASGTRSSHHILPACLPLVGDVKRINLSPRARARALSLSRDPWNSSQHRTDASTPGGSWQMTGGRAIKAGGEAGREQSMGQSERTGNMDWRHPSAKMPG